MTTPSMDPDDLSSPGLRAAVLRLSGAEKPASWDVLRAHLEPLVEEAGGVEKVARKAKVTPRRLEKLLTDDNPRVKDLMKVLDALRMSLADFFWMAELLGPPPGTDES